MANYKARIQLKHGKKADLPEDGRLAEPMYCTDTHELAIGNDKGEEYTFIGGVSEEQIRALERSLNDAIELAKKTASTLETDLVVNGAKIGSVSINNLGVSIKDNNNNVKFSVDTSFTTYAETLKVKNMSLSNANVTNTGIMSVTRGNKTKILTYYVSPTPKGKADGTSRDNACSDFYTVADTVFKQYGHLCPATKLQIWLDPGVYTQDMSIPYFPGNIWEIYIQTDVNGTSTFSRHVDIYHSNSSIHFCANSLGVIKFQSVECGDSGSTGDSDHRRAASVYGTNINLEFTHCHWVTPITSEYSKYCVYVAPGSRDINFSFSYCDFYGYDALVYKGESHGEILLYNCAGNLTYWIEYAGVIPSIMGLNIYLYGKCPVVTQEPHTEITMHKKAEVTPTNSSYYKTTTDPGGSGTVVQPPATTESWVNKEERYSIESPGTELHNWAAKFAPTIDPSENPQDAVCEGYGNTSLSGCIAQGSTPVLDSANDKIVYYHVCYGMWADTTTLLDHLHELGDKEKYDGTITNLTAKFVFTEKFISDAKPRVVYPPEGEDIPNHMVDDTGYYVTQRGANTSEGERTYVLELDGEHPLADALKNDLFYTYPAPINVDDSPYYVIIELGSYKRQDYGSFAVDLIVSYKEKATVVG